MTARHRLSIELSVCAIFGAALLGGLIVSASLSSEPWQDGRCGSDFAAVPVPVICEVAEIPQPCRPSPEPPAISRVAPHEGAAFGAFFFVREGELIVDEEADRSWGVGPILGEEWDEMVFEISLSRAIRPEALPASHAALLGTEVDLYGADGRVCVVRIDGFELRVRYQGERPYWSTEGDSSAEPSSIRERIFAEEDVWLVAQHSAHGDCAGARWARSPSLPAPELLSRASSSVYAESIRAMFVASPRFAEMERAYDLYVLGLGVEERIETPPWETFVGGALDVRVWETPDGVARFAGIELRDADAMCGDGFEPKHHQLVSITPEGVLTTIEGLDLPELLFDLDGDKRYERLDIFGEGDVLVGEGGLRREAVVYWHGCPC